MTSFIRLCDEIIALHEQNEPAPAPSLPVGAQVAKEFLEKAPQVVVELVNRYFTEVMRTAERAASDKGTRYSDEKFIQNYIDPLAVEHNIDSLNRKALSSKAASYSDFKRIVDELKNDVVFMKQIKHLDNSAVARKRPCRS